MILGRTERFVGFVQLSALVAADGRDRRDRAADRAVGAPGAVRRAALRDAAGGHPAVGDRAQRPRLRRLPASCCAYFLFTWTRVSLALAALALGLAIGTKITALLGAAAARAARRVPLSAPPLARARPRRRGGIALGSLLVSAQPRQDAATSTGRLAEAQHAAVGRARQHVLARPGRRALHAARRSTPSTRRAPSAATGSCTWSARPSCSCSGCAGARRFGVDRGRGGRRPRGAAARVPGDRPRAAARVPEALGLARPAQPRLPRLRQAPDARRARSSPGTGRSGLLLVLGGFVLVWIARRRRTRPDASRSCSRWPRSSGSCCRRSRPSTASSTGAT